MNYNLYDKYHISFKEEMKQLFLTKLKNIIDEINLKETYINILKSSENDLKGNMKISGNEEYEEILINCSECNENDILKILSIEDKVYSIKINDKINFKNLSIHFNENADNIIFSYKFFKEHKYILIRNNNLIIDTLNDHHYILWLLSVIGDFLYEFNDD